MTDLPMHAGALGLLLHWGDLPVLGACPRAVACFVVEDEGWLLFEPKLPRVPPNVAEID
jgi:hypothetical protein